MKLLKQIYLHKKFKKKVQLELNNIQKLINILTKSLNITNIAINVLQIGVQLAKTIPYPATGVPPALPPLTSGVQTTIASYVAKLENELKVINKNVSYIFKTS